MTEQTTQDEAAVVSLARILDLTAAAPLAAKLLELRGRPVIVNASEVERLGAQCAQVLLSASATWANDCVPLSIVDHSASFLADAQALGVSGGLLTE